MSTHCFEAYAEHFWFPEMDQDLSPDSTVSMDIIDGVLLLHLEYSCREYSTVYLEWTCRLAENDPILEEFSRLTSLPDNELTTALSALTGLDTHLDQDGILYIRAAEAPPI